MSKPVALVFGAGPKIGAAVANAFTNEGYAVAIASRSANDAEHPDDQGLLSVKADLAKLEDVKRAFERTKVKLGTPSVVVHNGERAIDASSLWTSSANLISARCGSQHSPVSRRGRPARPQVRHCDLCGFRARRQRCISCSSSAACGTGLCNASRISKQDLHLYRQRSQLLHHHRTRHYWGKCGQVGCRCSDCKLGRCVQG